MLDQFHREINYLRLSITPRCNLNCLYCRPGGCPTGQGLEAESGLLTPVEIGLIVGAAADLGIRKVRLTGGEPLMRADLEDIIREVRRHPAIEDLSLTTNGQGLAERAAGLKAAGLSRINISLDSLQAERYREITGGGRLAPVLAGIDACLAVGLVPVKLNTVLVRGINDDEIDALIELTRTRPLALRFIELMPMNEIGRDPDRLVTGTEILARYPELERVPEAYAGQPAEDFRLPGYVGTVGFIRPISHRFCHTCNRIRVTSDGKLKPCLGDLGEVDLKAALASGNPDTLRQLIHDTIYAKPEGHHFNADFKPKRGMDRTGG
jgi:cyclic pyranopterin phosphate synthase